MNTIAESGNRSYPLLVFLTALGRDRVFIAILAMTVLLGIFDRPQVAPSALFTLQALWEMLPFFLLAIGIAAFARASSADRLIADAFSGNPVRATVMAALVGAISPFCSCGVIPLIAAMLGAGVPLAPVMAFWIASPIMDPEMFVLTAAGIGFDFAVAKTVAVAAIAAVPPARRSRCCGNSGANTIASRHSTRRR